MGKDAAWAYCGIGNYVVADPVVVVPGRAGLIIEVNFNFPPLTLSFAESNSTVTLPPAEVSAAQPIPSVAPFQDGGAVSAPGLADQDGT